jgi:hypothetical protein
MITFWFKMIMFVIRRTFSSTNLNLLRPLWFSVKRWFKSFMKRLFKYNIFKFFLMITKWFKMIIFIIVEKFCFNLLNYFLTRTIWSGMIKLIIIITLFSNFLKKFLMITSWVEVSIFIAIWTSFSNFIILPFLCKMVFIKLLFLRSFEV